MGLPTLYQEYIHKSRYARWRKELARRENWPETINRYLDFFQDKFPNVITSDIRKVLFDYIYNLKTMPSMRCMMTAGEALERDNVAGFNCAYTTVSGEGERIELQDPRLDDYVVIHLSKPIDFDEILYVLMCGTGAGYSIERQYINHLPKVGHKLNRRIYQPNNKNFPNTPKEEISRFDRKDNVIRVHDSKIGWSSAVRIMIVELYNGNFDVDIDVSAVRPKGSILKTFGGRASGPGPLVELFKFSTNLFREANGRKLNSLECHDLVCMIADIVVVGGVRRAALISLSNLTDQRMRTAKSGDWGKNHGFRARANNSVAYTERPDVGIFMEEWKSLYESKAGERGIFSREAAKAHIARSGRRDTNHEFGCNPCSEILLRPKQFCNLSEPVVRPDDTYESLLAKVIVATILGTLQATLTDFRYLSPEWKINTEAEALLGVSMTGIEDHPVMDGREPPPESWGFPDLAALLRNLRDKAIKVNETWAKSLGINPSAAITCVKPSGTVSQLVDSASGIHARFAPFYVRRVRNDRKDPLAKYMKKAGFPCEEDSSNTSDMVFSFPMKAPAHSSFRDDKTAIEQLELWKIYALNWCEHKPSITIYVKEHEWLTVQAWVYSNFDIMSGVSFMPHSDHIYDQAPYEEITEEEYNEMVAAMPKEINWEEMAQFEKDDYTTGSQEYACTSGGCDIL